jgi:Reverse transcriptase (RNA-dependent DNA polymerase)
MTLPPDRKMKNNINLSCGLYKSIYELKQFSWTWYEKLSFYLILCKFKINNVDHSLFVKLDHAYITIVLVYMDDIIIIRNNLE